MKMPEDFSELENRLTDAAHASIEQAGAIARRANSPYVGTEHLLLGVLSQRSSLGAKVLIDSGVTLERAHNALRMTPDAFVVVIAQAGVSEEVIQAMRTSWQLATEFGQEVVGTEHLLYSMLSQENTRAMRLLRDMNVDIPVVRADLEQMFNRQQYDSLSGSSSKVMSKELAILEKYGVDMTRRANNGELDPVVGREKEIDRLMTILGRRRKNNPVLIGEPGVGKTAVVEGLATRIAEGRVSDFLRGKRLIQLDLVSMVAGTKYRGQFEERLQKVLSVVKKHPEIIVFIDELHILVGAGSAEGSMDAANIVKPALARGEVRMIGATTFDEYRKHIEKDAALMRRFQTVVVDEPSVEEATIMVRGMVGRLADHHNVHVDDDVLTQAVELAERYLTERRLPDKAIDVLDEASSLLRSEQAPAKSKKQQLERQIRQLAKRIDVSVEGQDYEQAAILKIQMSRLEKQVASLKETQYPQLSLDSRYVRRAVALMTDVPLAHIDQDQLRSLIKLESRLKKRVVGQDDVVAEVARVIKRARSGLASPNRPLGSFVFLGPTGVGKTELARALAEEVFGGEKSLIKIDMSELSERHTASRLVGAPAGYVGYDDGGKLTDAVRHHPYSVVLFDEIEKAHPDVLNLLLQLLEDGRLTDAKGRVASFRHTIIILTSNVGAAKMVRETELGFQATDATHQQELEDLHERNAREARRELELLMRPELINRFDGIMTFRALTRPVVGKIFETLAAEVRALVADQARSLRILPSVKRWLISEGYDAHHGVRPLRRVIERQLVGAIADVLIAGESRPGDVLEARMSDNKVVIDVIRS